MEDETLMEELDTEIINSQDYMKHYHLESSHHQHNWVTGDHQRHPESARELVSNDSFSLQARQTVKLPKLRKYDWKISQWQEFWSQYETAIHRNDALCKTSFLTSDPT
ncbi:hypothetical protein ATANTOWER_011360 [Ataeniobius toweri]|uniref:Uncharacterized protein n=1 Tax=Ataeniobius toweri TaxID=208326 RepID=A0ABU7AYC9_9TELE|nr:hypothetical protein [Ataeniobius toweri]